MNQVRRLKINNKFTIHETHRLLESKQVSSVELTRTYLERIQEAEPEVKALVTALTGYGYDSSGNVIGSKPGTSTRRVHTFALVPNKTPIIIGGLVSKQNEDTSNKIPGLSDIPFIGMTFWKCEIEGF